MSEPSKTSGQFNSAVGSMKETAGNAVGNTSLSNKGSEQHAEGEAETTAAKVQGYVQGGIDYATGAVKNVVGAATGNNTQEAEGKVQREKGNAQQEINK